jgi:hypothetical protein
MGLALQRPRADRDPAIDRQGNQGRFGCGAMIFLRREEVSDDRIAKAQAKASANRT